MNPPPAAESGCQMMKRLAKELEKSIHRSEQHADEVRARIAELEAQPVPDQSQIGALRQALDLLDRKVEDERASLSELQDVISENC